MGLWLQSLGPLRLASLDASVLLSALLLHCTTTGSIPVGRQAVAVYFARPALDTAPECKRARSGSSRNGPAGHGAEGDDRGQDAPDRTK